MKIITPYVVERDCISCGISTLDKGVYKENECFIDSDTIVELQEGNYESLPMCSVFVIPDDDGRYDVNEPSCFLMKMRHGDFYLTGDNENVLAVDRDEKHEVLFVV